MKIVKMIADASSFCLIATPWISEEEAEMIAKFCGAGDIKILLRDDTEREINSVKILQNNPLIEIRRDPNLHGKCIITEFELYSGSGNMTFSAFKKNHEFFEFDKNEDRRKIYFKKFMKWFNASSPFAINEDKDSRRKVSNRVLLEAWKSI